MSATTIYFAQKSGRDLGAELKERIERFNSEFYAHPVYQLQRASTLQYHGMNAFGVHMSSTIRPGGAQGELAAASANLFREFLVHITQMTTHQRPNWQAQATNTDSKSIAQTILAQSLLDTYFVQQRVEDRLREAAEIAVRCGEAFVAVLWDGTAGEVEEAVEEVIDPETGEVIQQVARIPKGDLKFKTYGTQDVIRDPAKRANSENRWVILRDRMDKFELAARYKNDEDPELAEHLHSLGSSFEEDLRLGFRPFHSSKAKSDDVSVFTLLHERTDACPDGKEVVFLADGTVLFEGPLSYQEVPVYRISASDWAESIWGYSFAFDLLGLQMTHSMMFSTILTNLKNTAISHVVMRPQSNISIVPGSGMKIIQAEEGQEPKALNLTAVPGDTYQLMGITEQLMEKMSGANSVVRGQPDSNIKSGSFAALISQQALTFSDHLQASYTRLLEQVGTAAIRILRVFADKSRTAAIVGKANQYILREFNKDDLAMVDRVTVESGNPLTRTAAGRMDLADRLLQMNALKSPTDLVQVLTTGRLDSVIEGQQRQEALIRKENELLAEGKPVRALITDLHRAHIQKHLAELDDPAIRADEARTSKVLAHVMEHKTFLQTMDPAIADITGQPPLGGGPPQGTPPPPPGLPSGTQPPAQGQQDVSPYVATMGDLPRPPNLPKNPVSGEQWNPEDGGMPQA